MKDTFENMSLNRSSNNDDETKDHSGVMVPLLNFWLKQISGAKNEESKASGILFQQEVCNRIVREEALISKLDDKTKASEEESIIKFIVYFLKCIKNKSGNNLRGKKMTLQNYMLNKLYHNQAAWTEYFNFLKDKVKNSTTIPNVNFY